jgi:hypothetical protein
MKESSEKTKTLSMVKFEKNKTLFIVCDCKSEVLVLEYDHEYDLTELSIYENLSSYNYKMSFWQKFRYLYQILIKSRPYSDQIILNKEKIKHISNFLISINQN